MKIIQRVNGIDYNTLYPDPGTRYSFHFGGAVPAEDGWALVVAQGVEDPFWVPRGVALCLEMLGDCFEPREVSGYLVSLHRDGDEWSCCRHLPNDDGTYTQTAWMRPNPRWS